MKEDEEDIGAWAWVAVRKSFKSALTSLASEFTFLSQGIEIPKVKKMSAAVRKARRESMLRRADENEARRLEEERRAAGKRRGEE